MSKWRGFVGMNTRMGVFLRRHPHVFDVYAHPVRKNLCCRVSGKMRDLVEEEAGAVRDGEEVAVCRLKKLLLMAPAGCLHTHALWLIRRELGLPDDFRVSVLAKYNRDFRLVDPGGVALVGRDEGLAVAEVERWREREYREKWLSEFETKYAFKMSFPTGFRIEKGFRERLKNWQRLPYLKPYEIGDGNGVSRRACGGGERFEKRAVGIIHELLSLTVEKMVEVERLSHFRRDFGVEVNIRELLLKHPGIFYISTKGNKQTVYLREAYSKGCLVEPNPVYLVRMKMLELICLGCRNTRELQRQKYVEEEKCVEVDRVHFYLVCPVLESLYDENVSCNSRINITSDVDSDNEHE